MDKEQAIHPPTPTRLEARIGGAGITDDESITTSTESDTFETWTLVTEEKKSDGANKKLMREPNDHIKLLDQDEPGVEPNNEREKHELLKPEVDTSLDELSDGISIISESESGGRYSPHPFLEKQLSDLHIKYTTGEEMDTLLPTELPEMAAPNITVLPYASNLEVLDNETRLRRRRLSQSRSRSRSKSKEQELVKVTTQVSASAPLPRLVRHGLTGLFYVGVTLAILAFIGKLRYPEWNLLSDTKPISDLEQKLNEMELQNNLMRAEIDILTKQVNYLNTLKDERDQKNKPSQYEKKTFQAWSGNGDSLDPVRINKYDLKKPYKCSDGRFVEIAGMCVENAHKKPQIIDEIGDAVNEVLQESEPFKTLEKLNDKFDGIVKPVLDKTEKLDMPDAKSTPNSAKAQPPKDFEDRKSDQPSVGAEREYNRNREQDYKQEYRSKPDKVERSQDYDEKQSKESHKRYKNYNSKERSEEFKSNEHKHRKPEKRDDHFSNSKEKRKRERYDSKESSEKQRKKFDSSERKGKDGHWHEKMMQHRENERRKNDRDRGHINKNWYIERADSREQMRQR